MSYPPTKRAKDPQHEHCQVAPRSLMVRIAYEGQPQQAELVRIAEAVEGMKAKIGRREQRIHLLDDAISTSQAINVDALIVEHAALQLEREKLGGGRGSRGEPFRAQKRKIRLRLEAITHDLAAAVPATIEGHIQDRARTAESLARKRKDLATLLSDGRALERTLPALAQQQWFGSDA